MKETIIGTLIIIGGIIALILLIYIFGIVCRLIFNGEFDYKFSNELLNDGISLLIVFSISFLLLYGGYYLGNEILN